LIYESSSFCDLDIQAPEPSSSMFAFAFTRFLYEYLSTRRLTVSGYGRETCTNWRSVGLHLSARCAYSS